MQFFSKKKDYVIPIIYQLHPVELSVMMEVFYYLTVQYSSH